ncbi:MAG: hypothetical protein RDU20_22930 [Desulfomonilaceae bacterium]|nr:hypothetical protein [Desulfomonilaceae bacterium]
MYWKIGNRRTALVTIPLYTVGNELAFSITLVTESEEEIDAAYLFTPQPSCAGLLQARRAGDESYSAVMGPFDANCLLGRLRPESEVTVDFLVHYPHGTADGYAIVPVAIGWGAAAVPVNPYFMRDWPAVWHDDWPHLWREDF